MLFGLGVPELLLVLAIVVVLFGASRVGDIGKGIGRGIREFRRELREGQQEEDKEAPKETASTKEVSATGEEKSRYTQH